MRTGLAIGPLAVGGPGEEEVGGVFERGGIAGAFGGRRAAGRRPPAWRRQ